VFGPGHLFGRRAGLREFGAQAELRRRELTVEPLRSKPACPPIFVELKHWRSDGQTRAVYKCGRRRWELDLGRHDEIEDAVRTAKEAARYWRGLLQSGRELPARPSWPVEE
jgi:hypothetical protein